MKKVSLILCVLLTGTVLQSFAQSQKANASPEYTLSATISNVEFYQAMTNCNGKSVVLLKFINKNNYNVEVSWKELFVTAQVREETEGFRQNKLTLTPGTTGASGCDDATHKDLVISGEKVNPAYAADIQKFRFQDIQVTPLH